MINFNCTSVNHCGNIYTCERCARERQRKLADKAELLEKHFGPLTLTVLVPESNTQEAIRRLRASFIRRTLASSGLWTIETGSQFAGLHINFLSPAPITASWKNAKCYSELVNTTSREAAAYIAKRSGLPPKEQFIGRTSGTFGQLFNYLSNKDAPPLVQAATIEASLRGEIMKKNPEQDIQPMQDWSKIDRSKPTFFNKDFPAQCNPPLMKKELSPADKYEIMRKHLPLLYAACDLTKAYKPPN